SGLQRQQRKCQPFAEFLAGTLQGGALARFPPVDFAPVLCNAIGGELFERDKGARGPLSPEHRQQVLWLLYREAPFGNMPLEPEQSRAKEAVHRLAALFAVVMDLIDGGGLHTRSRAEQTVD